VQLRSHNLNLDFGAKAPAKRSAVSCFARMSGWEIVWYRAKAAP
jgi:hypothetical protein